MRWIPRVVKGALAFGCTVAVVCDTTGGIGAVYVAGLLLTVAVGEIDPQVAPKLVFINNTTATPTITVVEK